jgi:acyl dehydratase
MTVTNLTTSPSLLPLFGKAAVAGPLHRGGDQLPDSVYTLAGQRVDAAHLAAFQRLIGARVREVLPPTYLHIMAFPLSMALMSEREFPFPLIGTVHVNNTITVHRPVTSDEEFFFTVRVDHLRPHPAGRQFDVLAEVTVGDEVVWNGVSTYLRRGKGSGERSESKPRESVEPSGAVSTIKVPANIGRKYGALSGDRNPIHLHSLTAKAFGFNSAIAHGMWLKARTLSTVESRLPDSYTADVAFKTPVFLPSTIALRSTVEDSRWALDVRNARSGKPHLAGTVTA